MTTALGFYCARRNNVTNRQMALSSVFGLMAVAVALTEVVRATAGSGVLSATVVARGTFTDPTDIKFKIDALEQEVIHAPNAQQTVVQQIIIGPGGHTGWHSHPGPVVVVVTAGTLTFYSADDPACTPRTYGAGSAFVDSGQGHVHIARNESTIENLELWATYFDVPSPPPANNFRIDALVPGNCSF
jgi:quercetin dioxygenase-like cupin family protein